MEGGGKTVDGERRRRETVRGRGRISKSWKRRVERKNGERRRKRNSKRQRQDQ